MYSFENCGVLIYASTMTNNHHATLDQFPNKQVHRCEPGLNWSSLSNKNWYSLSWNQRAEIHHSPSPKNMIFSMFLENEFTIDQWDFTTYVIYGAMSSVDQKHIFHTRCGMLLFSYINVLIGCFLPVYCFVV